MLNDSLLSTVKCKKKRRKKRQLELNIFNNSKEECLLPSMKELTKATFKSTCDFKSSVFSV